jgi:hypothetical protein
MKKKPLVIVIHDVAHFASRPVIYVVDCLHIRGLIKSRRRVKVLLGLTLMLTGSTMALHPVSFIPHILWDMFSYGLHGYGAVPIIKVICQKSKKLSIFDLETLEEESEVEVKRDVKKLQKFLETAEK